MVEAAFGALNASPHCGKNVGKVRRCAWDPGFVGVVLRKFHDAVAIARRAGGPVVVLSDSAAVPPLLKRAYPEVRLVAPPGEPGHVNPSRAPAVRTNAMPAIFLDAADTAIDLIAVAFLSLIDSGGDDARIGDHS